MKFLKHSIECLEPKHKHLDVLKERANALFEIKSIRKQQKSYLSLTIVLEAPLLPASPPALLLPPPLDEMRP